ncbi:MAG: proline dehydrogenase family protein, partial [Acidobacteriota bacterium]|nr:proline dehydrogenase family protein [Acidobacteriota bacterium]
MIDATSKALFHTLAQIGFLQRLASGYGMRPGGFARRFIAGESAEEALATIGPLAGRGLRLTLDYLGESVSSFDQAAAAAQEYVRIIDAIVAAGVERNISLKLTQLGLDVDRATAVDNMRRILEPADRHGFFVRIDMENSPYVDRTLQVLDTLWQQGHHGLGTVIQSCLIRSPQDVAHLNTLGARVRLVKGAYKEPKAIAFQDKAQVDAAFIALMRELLDHGVFPAIATHDPAMIAETKRYAEERGHAKDRFEFQMLFGVRRDLQATLMREGYGMRVYVPFGRQWFPYFMRRLGERPANLGFVLRSLLRDRQGES